MSDTEKKSPAFELGARVIDRRCPERVGTLREYAPPLVEGRAADGSPKFGPVMSGRAFFGQLRHDGREFLEPVHFEHCELASEEVDAST